MSSGGSSGVRPRTSTPHYGTMPVDPPNTRSGRYTNNQNRQNTNNSQPAQNAMAAPQSLQNSGGQGGANATNNTRGGASATHANRGSPQQPRPSRPQGPQILHSMGAQMNAIAAELLARGGVPGGGLNPTPGGGTDAGASRNTQGSADNQASGVNAPTTPSRPPVAGGVPTVGGTPNNQQGNVADAGRSTGAPSATPTASSASVPPVLPVPPTRSNNRGQSDSGVGRSHGPISQQGGTTPDLDETVLQSLAPSINETMTGRRRVLNQSSDTGSHSSDWDHLGDIGAGNGNRQRN